MALQRRHAAVERLPAAAEQLIGLAVQRGERRRGARQPALGRAQIERPRGCGRAAALTTGLRQADDKHGEEPCGGDDPERPAHAARVADPGHPDLVLLQ
jgi:hypothetical protein